MTEMDEATAEAVLRELGSVLTFRKASSEERWFGPHEYVIVVCRGADKDLYIAMRNPGWHSTSHETFEDAKAACERHHATGKWQPEETRPQDQHEAGPTGATVA